MYPMHISNWESVNYYTSLKTAYSKSANRHAKPILLPQTGIKLTYKFALIIFGLTSITFN